MPQKRVDTTSSGDTVRGGFEKVSDNATDAETRLSGAESHATDKANPHGVTASQAGALAQADHTKAAHDALGLDAGTLDGLDSQAFYDFTNEARNLIMSGGGNISWAADRLSWSARFLLLPAPDDVSSSNHVSLTYPASVLDHNELERRNADGIQLASYDTLWFIHQRGGDQSTGNSWRVLPYNHALINQYYDDENAYLIAVRNGEAGNGSLYLRNGLVIPPGRTIFAGKGIPAITSADFGPSYIDGGATIASLRTLGTGALQAAPGNHKHQNYQALLESNLDDLLRGVLYSRASPFSQSFTFSGDGTKTAFKIARTSVNQQGWVRGGVTATVGGAAATGTWNVHTQTFTFDVAPASAVDNVVISSTDVVPYQGMATTADTVELLYWDHFMWVTTSGTGGTTTASNTYFPTTPKLPSLNIPNDDAHLCDMPNSTSMVFGANAPMNILPESRVHGNPLYPMKSGRQSTLTVRSATANNPRGATTLGHYIYQSITLSASMPHTTFVPLLMKVVTPAAGSPFSAGEVVLGIVGRYLTSSEVRAGGYAPDYDFDLFRLNNGPIVEAA